MLQGRAGDLGGIDYARLDCDPRRAVAERYASREEYLSRYSREVDELVKQRWILEEDRAGLMRRGEVEWEEAVE
ncbi:MAG: alpha/beta hydrolase domain-containing protein [Bryobacteraceae bacterium]